MKDPKSSIPGKKRLPGKSDKVVQLVTQAERARKIASECRSQLIADLFEVHAQLCERNAQVLGQRARRWVIDYA
jgi:hypothetical protein